MNMTPDRDPAFGDEVLHDVAVVGLGPTGVTLALLLARRGLRVLVLERDAEIHALPRAVHFDGECMRVFQGLGLADSLLPQLIVSPGMKFVDATGRVLIDWSRSREIGPQGWHPSYRFHQPSLERALRDRLAGCPSATVRLHHDAFAIEPQGDRVVLRVEDGRSGRLLRTAARWVVGADGARSLVRRVMGTELDDLRSHERWLVVDVILDRDRPDLGDHSIQYCDPRRPATYVRGVGRRRRWELMLMPGDDPATIARPESVWSLLARWVTPHEATLERPAVYTFHSVVARGWRRGRLLIAGDAAHQTPPFMGQGMCAGLRDAANLGWKLADVVQGNAPESLLDTYESERSPHVREFIETAVRLGGVIQATDPELVRRRDAEMAANPQVFRTPEPALGPGAHDGADGRRLDDRVGDRFALVARPELLDAEECVDTARFARIAADDPALAAWLDALGAPAALLRPDRYLAGRARDRHEMESLIRRHVGWGGGASA
jgi:3-(3-hydroxy-phenyl)propionate hydroxylase